MMPLAACIQAGMEYRREFFDGLDVLVEESNRTAHNGFPCFRASWERGDTRYAVMVEPLTKVKMVAMPWPLLPIPRTVIDDEATFRRIREHVRQTEPHPKDTEK